MNTSAYIDSLENGHINCIQNGLKWINASEFIKPETRVFIKPNLTFPTYRPGVMTDPKTIEASIQVLRAYTPHLFIGDSDSGGYNRFPMEDVYRNTGIIDFANKYGVQVVNLSRGPRKTIQFKYRNKDFSLDLPRLLTDEIDILITMPVPKVHANSGVSLTFKNQWGCIPENKDRLRLHPYLQHVILEVNKAVKAKLAIVDGTFGLNINGPMRGQPVELNWILVANDIGAGARVTCEIMQINLEKIQHLRYASQLGFIPALNEIRLNKDLNPFKKVKFTLKRKWTDWPGVLAYRYPAVAYLGYFSPLAKWLHHLLYLVREPFYDYHRDISNNRHL
jgi:uncharacterized protein (DUF362 family)